MRKVTLLFIIISTIFLNAQQGDDSSFFFSQMSFYNPAYVGSNFVNEVSLSTRNQWTSIENSPRGQLLTLSSPRKNNVGLGISAFTRKNFVERRSLAYIDFSYKLQFSSEKFLFLGLKGGTSLFKTDFSEISNQSIITDPALNNTNRVKPNLGIGILLKYPKFYFSFSIPRLFSQSDNNFEYNNERMNTYLGVGFKKEVLSNIGFETNAFLRLIQGSKAIMDLNGLLSFNENLKLGANYRTNNTISPLLQLRINNLDIGYGYEFSLNNNLVGLGVKTHEIFLKFILENKDTVDQEESSE
ncbi:type IX secretion system membrane protein PorP/SprF [Flavobacteriaceae bacterium]|nr:type IX secretion system membrane protein PorP/SprF [Flavobacteriaceae bacterium]